MNPRTQDLVLTVVIAAAPAVLWPLGLLWWALALVVVLAALATWRNRRAVAAYRRRFPAREPAQQAGARTSAPR